MKIRTSHSPRLRLQRTQVWFWWVNN